MKKERIIYQDKAAINLTLSGCDRALVTIQKAINTIKDTGLKINDDVLLDLMLNSGRTTKELAERQINEEANKFVLQTMKEQIIDQLQPLLDKIGASVTLVHNALHVNDHTSFSTTLPVDYFTIKNLDVNLVDNLEELVTEKYTLYATEQTEHLLDLAEATKESIEALNAAFKEIGSQLNAFRDHPYPWGYSIFIYEEGMLKINYEAFRTINN